MTNQEITSEHTYTRIAQGLEELEALRLEMGRNKDARVSIQVRDALAREVFYHAHTVHRKANQLCVELGAVSVSTPMPPVPSRAQAADVLKVLDSARERIAMARAYLRLEGETTRPELPGPLVPSVGKDATDVLTGCLLASRQLNVMLTQGFASREAHERLVRALVVSERLLATHGLELPQPPALQRRKFPRDVFQLLWEVCEDLQRTLTVSGVIALQMDRGFVGEQPTDVYDIASLILSELEFLTTFLPPSSSAPFVTTTPSPILPAHNFRRALQLQAAIKALGEAVDAKPGWLQQSGA